MCSIGKPQASPELKSRPARGRTGEDDIALEVAAALGCSGVPAQHARLPPPLARAPGAQGAGLPPFRPRGMFGGLEDVPALGPPASPARAQSSQGVGAIARMPGAMFGGVADDVPTLGPPVPLTLRAAPSAAVPGVTRTALPERGSAGTLHGSSLLGGLPGAAEASWRAGQGGGLQTTSGVMAAPGGGRELRLGEGGPWGSSGSKKAGPGDSPGSAEAGTQVGCSEPWVRRPSGPAAHECPCRALVASAWEADLLRRQVQALSAAPSAGCTVCVSLI